MTQQLKLNAASLSKTGRKQPAINEDYVAWKVPEEPHLLISKGAILAVADGVSSAGAGREASEQAVERFISEYYQTPDTWSVGHCGKNILSTVNLRLYRRSLEYGTEGKGFLSTFSALVIKGQLAHFFHIGDSRIYYLPAAASIQAPEDLKSDPNRNDSSTVSSSFRCLTHDHSRTVSDKQTFLTRAIGMDNHLPLDYGQQMVSPGDSFLLSSDGIHDFIDDSEIEDIMRAGGQPEDICETFLKQALENGSDDNLSVVYARIESLTGSITIDDQGDKNRSLPFPPDNLSSGMILDGYKIEKELFTSSRSQLYLVSDTHSSGVFAMKIPSKNFEDDSHYIDRFIQEEWIGQRIKSDNVVKVIRPERQKTALYYLMEFVDGQSLDKWMVAQQSRSPKAAIEIVEQIAKGLQAFHDNEAIHQDLKPANIMVKDDGRIVIVDFGSVYVAGLAELRSPNWIEGALGTASYSDPLYLLGKNPGIAGDVYSLATIAYEMFTAKLPYGDAVDEFSTAAQYHRLKYIRANEHNPIIPVWFDRALEKGVNFDIEQRYSTVSDLYQDLRYPNPDFLRDDPPAQNSSGSLLFWKLMSGFWFGVIVLLVYLFSKVS